LKDLRKYGRRPYRVAVVHGGPGAPGEMAPVARELSSITGVLEPLQTKVTLEGQVQELRGVLEKNGELPVILIGHSWGAWLAYIVTARYGALVRKLILVGSGAFEERYAANIVGDRLTRLSEAERIEFLGLVDNIDKSAPPDKDKSLVRLGELAAKADTYAALPGRHLEIIEGPAASEEINRKVNAEAMELRASGRLLSLGRRIACPVVAIHGDYDPHLAEGVREPLCRVLRDFRFILLEKCGHEPWIERYARDRFYRILKDELE
jgi:pimeloyl-ACP methyl ester carboxylesterase